MAVAARDTTPELSRVVATRDDTVVVRGVMFCERVVVAREFAFDVWARVDVVRVALLRVADVVTRFVFESSLAILRAGTPAPTVQVISINANANNRTFIKIPSVQDEYRKNVAIGATKNLLPFTGMTNCIAIIRRCNKKPFQKNGFLFSTKRY